MKINRRFTSANTPVTAQIKWKKVDVEIAGTDSTFTAVEVPEQWSDDAARILASKYFRRAGVPSETMYVPNGGFVDRTHPTWLFPSKAKKDTTFGGETSARQVFHRLAGHWTFTGWKEGYFTGEIYASAFYDELYWMLAHQFAAPNSPQWFNTGLWWAYGIEGENAGLWIFDAAGNVSQIANSYERPQVHACFINSIEDNLVEPGGIFDLLTREARIFKFGSGSGANFSNLRGKGEALSGGGRSSGLMSFLEIFDRAAGAIQSGGTTRRAAKMVVLDADHPEIEDFINWKVKEEAKAASMFVGSRAMREGTAHGIPAMTDRISHDIVPDLFGIEWEGEAMRTVGGQNSNNSVRFRDEFFAAVDNGECWHLRNRTDGSIAKTVWAADLWTSICRAAWACADPGVQFHTTINAWHTCAADGEILASNPCSEYMHLDNTACNLASLNLARFLLPSDDFNLDALEHATHLWTIMLDISISMASFPSREIAEGTWKYRTLGLGYANAGGLLMRLGISYDSVEGRAVIAAITALMHGESLLTSAKLASELGAFPRWEANANSMDGVIRKHKFAIKRIDYGDLVGKLSTAALYKWQPLTGGCAFRNAQTTLIAPTGTISFVMDCPDFTGIEPAFALRVHKNLAGGGHITLTNSAIKAGLERLGYKAHTINLIEAHIATHGTIRGCPDIKPEHIAVFETSNEIRPLAHVEMVAAVQPFLSGAVSKTVNLPRSATMADVDAVYRAAHRLGLKSIALYRDGSKLTQPLSTASTEETADLISKSDSAAEADAAFANEIVEEWNRGVPTNRIVRGGREALLPRRKGYTHKLKVGDQTLYLRTGEYEDGRLGEIFLSMSKEGGTTRAIMEGFAKSISIGLQYGVPLSEMVDAFVHVKFEPAGVVQGHDRIKMCQSIFDLVFRELGLTYLGREELANVPAASDREVVVDRYAENVEKYVGIVVKAGRRFNQAEMGVTAIMGTASGFLCSNCGAEMRRTGSCLTCPDCFANTGCG